MGSSVHFGAPMGWGTSRLGKAETPRVSGHRPRRCRGWPARALVEDVFVLDFDGVVCDSGGEVMSAGLAVAKKMWPEAFVGIHEETVLESLHRVRPRLVSGFESVLMARQLAEKSAAAEDDILNCPDWLARVDALLAEYGCSREELQSEFESWRQNRVEVDYDGWLALNPLYKDVRDAIDACPGPTYFASSKAGRRLVPLLRSLLEIDLDEDSPRLLHSLIPPNELKLDALKNVSSRPVASDLRTTLHFVDDRFETIEYILEHADDALLRRYNLYLASWGYCTQEEIERAQATPGVRVISLEDFCELLRFGIIMNVNDGCQDTDEEARNAVYRPRGS